VTNREYSAFVKAGGYDDPALWPELADRDAREAARSTFVDATRRVGSGPWEVGAPVTGEEELPVSGVSWHEALAYCLWAGKELPTMLHWSNSSGVFFMGAEVIPESNLDGDALAAVGTFTGVGPTGIFDMGGNAREWVWNKSGNGRLILGGAWNDPGYFLSHSQAFDPLDRSLGNGFRCIRETQSGPDHELARASVARNMRDYYTETPVDDAVFEVYRRQFAYDPIPLDVRVEETGEAA
jgi:formylglycine-generating enzyme required for sulfatase activity